MQRFSVGVEDVSPGGPGRNSRAFGGQIAGAGAPISINRGSGELEADGAGNRRAAPFVLSG